MPKDPPPLRESAGSPHSGPSVQPVREVEARDKSDKTRRSVSFLFPDLSNDRLFNPGRVSLSTLNFSAHRARTLNLPGRLGSKRDRSGRPHYITFLGRQEKGRSFVLQKTAPHGE